MIIDATLYCGLSRRADFQEWLKSVSIECHEELISWLKLGKSCSKNKIKMTDIYEKLKIKGLDDELIKFLQSRYPHMLIHTNSKIDIVAKPKQQNIQITIDDANHHKIFKVYKPGLLMIPQQIIFVNDDYDFIYNQTISFIRNKINTDYIILKGEQFWHSYIEYFDKRYANYVDKLLGNRQIKLYKIKNGLT
jgi:hypothetical protein